LRNRLNASIAHPSETYFYAYVRRERFTHYKRVLIYPALFDLGWNTYSGTMATSRLPGILLHYLNNLDGRRGLDPEIVATTASVLAQAITARRYIEAATNQDHNNAPPRITF
jgi:hypothetical protein